MRAYQVSFQNSLVGILIGVVMTGTVFMFAGTAATEASGWEDGLERIAHEVLEQGYIPGAAVVVVQGDDVVFLRGFGFADMEAKREVTPKTIFYIASSTKSFTGLTSAILAHRGRIDLDAPVSRYHAGLKFAAPLSGDEITLRQLLTHTHGIDNGGPVTFRSAYSGQHTPELLAELLQYHQPASYGTEFRYGNIGYNVAGLVLGQAMGKSWKELLHEEIFVPLEMVDTTAYLSRSDKSRLAMPYRHFPAGLRRADYAKGDSNMHAAGGLVTTVDDLGRWLRANLNQGRLGGEQVIPAQAFQEAHRQAVPTDGRRGGAFAPHHYGLGWNFADLQEKTVVHHFGGFNGFHSHISFMPDEKIGVAILINEAGPGSLVAGLLARYAYRSLMGEEGLDETFAVELEQSKARFQEFKKSVAADSERRSKRPQTLPRPLADYAGTYSHPVMGEVVFSLVEGGLEMDMGQIHSGFEVYDAEKNQLRVEVGGSGQVVTFEFGEEGPAAAIIVEGVRLERVN